MQQAEQRLVFLRPDGIGAELGELVMKRAAKMLSATVSPTRKAAASQRLTRMNLARIERMG